MSPKQPKHIGEGGRTRRKGKKKIEKNKKRERERGSVAPGVFRLSEAAIGEVIQASVFILRADDLEMAIKSRGQTI